MKKVIVILVAFIVMHSFVKAQVLTKGENAFNIGIGIPVLYNGGASISMPAFLAAFDHGFSEKLGIGYISGGAQIAFSGGNNTISGIGSSYTYLTIGPRAAYHFDFYDISNGKETFKKLDIYAGVFVGTTFTTTKVDLVGGGTDRSTGTAFTEDVFVGIRYSFSNSLGVYAESGYNVSFLNAGLTWRF